MNDFNLLLRSIITNPDEDSVRLAMADWYEEHGQSERAEFIRVQVELAKIEYAASHDDASCCVIHCSVCDEKARLPGLRDRERELTDKLWESMRPFVLLVPNKWEFTRGFISHVTCSAEDFLKHADQLVWHPNKRDCGHEGLFSPCPDTAQPIQKVKLTTHSGFPIGENALQHTNVREFFESRPFPYSEYFRVRGWDSFRPMVPVQGKLDHYTCDVWPGIEFECLPPMVDVRLNSGGQGVDTLDAGPAPIRHNDPITSDIEGRAVPAGHSSSLDWVIGTATGPSRV